MYIKLVAPVTHDLRPRKGDAMHRRLRRLSVAFATAHRLLGAAWRRSSRRSYRASSAPL